MNSPQIDEAALNAAAVAIGELTGWEESADICARAAITAYLSAAKATQSDGICRSKNAKSDAQTDLSLTGCTQTIKQADWVMVPRIPTDEMLKQGVAWFQSAYSSEDTLNDWRACYMGMIAAAPKPNAPEE